MGLFGYAKDVVTIVSVLGLVIVGLTIALKSGSVATGPQSARPVLRNLSEVVITLAGCLLLLGMIQQLIGLRLTTVW